MHLNEEQIQRFLHDELDARTKATLSQHVAGCSTCARELAVAEREEQDIFELLGSVDHPAPRVEAESFTFHRGAWAVWGRRAAGFVIAAALAGAAYAIPGSPLPALLKQVAIWIADQDSAPNDEETSSIAGPVTSGIAVPVSERFTIDFTAEQTGSDVAVSLTDETNLIVRALGGTATFTTDVDRLTIDNHGSAADYEVEIPRTAGFVEIRVGTRRFVLKDGDAFAAGLPFDDRGRTIISLTTPGH